MNDFDAGLVLTFLAAYHALEQALVQAGFTRAGRRSGEPQPDWGGFVRYIEGKFDPGSSPELMGAVCTLLGQPGARELGRELLTPVSDVLWLAERVREIRDRLLLRINFAGGTLGRRYDCRGCLVCRTGLVSYRSEGAEPVAPVQAPVA